MLALLAATLLPPQRIYATLNLSDKTAGTTLSNGNLTASQGQYDGVRSTVGKSSGKWSWEIHFDSSSGADYYQPGINQSGNGYAGLGIGGNSNDIGYVAVNGSYRYSSADHTGKATATAGDVIRVELDMSVPQVEFFKNNVSQGTHALAAGTYYAAQSVVAPATCVVTYNFGATPFVNSPSAGFNTGLYT